MIVRRKMLRHFQNIPVGNKLQVTASHQAGRKWTPLPHLVSSHGE